MSKLVCSIVQIHEQLQEQYYLWEVASLKTKVKEWEKLVLG